MEKRVLGMICAMAAQIAVAASHFKGRLNNATTNRTSEGYVTRSRRYWGTGSKYKPSYSGAQGLAAARNLRHMNAYTHGLCPTGFA